MNSTYIVAAGWWFLSLIFLANGFYAMFSPRAWLRAWWTAHRSMGPETSSSSIRVIGAFLVLFGMYGAVIAVKLTNKIIHQTTGYPSMPTQLIFKILWWAGALMCLGNGIWAFIAPTPWSRFTQRHGGLWTALLGRPAIIRILGAAGIVIGWVWIAQGFRAILK